MDITTIKSSLPNSKRHLSIYTTRVHKLTLAVDDEVDEDAADEVVSAELKDDEVDDDDVDDDD